MTIIFRCSNCETINDIPNNHQYRICKKCGKIITYDPGESIIVTDVDSADNVFLKSGKLSTVEAEKFFTLADDQIQEISAILMLFQKISVPLIDIHAKSLPDIILSILQQSKTNSLDELIRNCRNFDIPFSKVEDILLQMKKEGYIYQPQSWLIFLA